MLEYIVAQPLTVLLGLFLLWNGCTLLLMGLDKFKARRGSRRISERTLLLAAFALGGPGALLGSMLFRHKSRKRKFRVLLPLAVLANLTVLAAGLWALGLLPDWTGIR